MGITHGAVDPRIPRAADNPATGVFAIEDLKHLGVPQLING
jgi:hypothetical protein